MRHGEAARRKDLQLETSFAGSDTLPFGSAAIAWGNCMAPHELCWIFPDAWRICGPGAGFLRAVHLPRSGRGVRAVFRFRSQFGPAHAALCQRIAAILLFDGGGDAAMDQSRERSMDAAVSDQIISGRLSGKLNHL